MLYISKIKYILFFIIIFQLNHAIYISSGLKTLNRFLFSSRFKKYYYQNKIKTCSINDGPNCYFTERKYVNNYNQFKSDDGINDKWANFYNKTDNNDYEKILNLFNIDIKRYFGKYSNQIDKNQNSQGKVFKYLLSFDYFDKFTLKGDIYMNEKLSEIFYNQEIILDITGKLKLSYDKDISEDYLRTINKDYPSTTFGIIESKFIRISFRGKAFICSYLYIKAQNEKSKSEQIHFYGYIGNNLVYNYNYQDNKKRNEKWLKVYFPNPTPINILVISGPYDIDNIFFTFLNKKYDESNLYNSYNHKLKQEIIVDEDV